MKHLDLFGSHPSIFLHSGLNQLVSHIIYKKGCQGVVIVLLTSNPSQRLQIKSCDEAIHLAYRRSVVVFGYLVPPEIMHEGAIMATLHHFWLHQQILAIL